MDGGSLNSELGKRKREYTILDQQSIIDESDNDGQQQKRIYSSQKVDKVFLSLSIPKVENNQSLTVVADGSQVVRPQFYRRENTDDVWKELEELFATFLRDTKEDAFHDVVGPPGTGMFRYHLLFKALRV
jgi:hypothetical protein